MPELVDKIDQYLQYLEEKHIHPDILVPVLSSFEKALCKIILDLTDRRGIRTSWYNIEEGIKEKICEKWLGFINDAIIASPLQVFNKSYMPARVCVVLEIHRSIFENLINISLEEIQKSPTYFSHQIDYQYANDNFIAFITYYDTDPEGTL